VIVAVVVIALLHPTPIINHSKLIEIVEMEEVELELGEVKVKEASAPKWMPFIITMTVKVNCKHEVTIVVNGFRAQHVEIYHYITIGISHNDMTIGRTKEMRLSLNGGELRTKQIIKRTMPRACNVHASCISITHISISYHIISYHIII
jgi:hypothetical protein